MSFPTRLLVVNQFGVCVGFYMIIPFLATYLSDLGFAAAFVGVVLGVRTLSQQGMYLVGGSAADRIGCRPMILIGCGLRAVAFGIFALTASPVGLVVATALTGLAGALFAPAVRTYIVHESPERTAEVFSVFNVSAHAGTLLGPLVGMVLLGVDFRLVAVVACATFAVLTAAQAVWLPRRDVVAQRRTILGAWREVFGNPRFALFTAFGSVYFALYNQLYLVLPMEAQRVTGTQAAIGAVFVVSTIVGITVQIPLTRWAKARWRPGTCVALGLAAMGGGFGPVLLSAQLLPDAGAPVLLPGLAVLAGTVVFTVGIALTEPFIMQLLPALGSSELLGTYYGYYYLVAGILAAAASAAVGALMDVALFPAAPALLLIVLGMGAGAGMLTLQRRGVLEARS